ncbi:MAG: Transketolase, thiamine diphosphate binding domain-containing protein [Olpidium bornovanus]|uniref:Transketolase, thiamine diphosphate binding domain-containing protein n=1 Tax=Olpidium bornovanus TaxID=278681 RepID=A0A8H8DGT1_9FUNG|nr:MAG: Transketolase, thiamine diphosphate binding domain-containing protein [Olpidium bornovanus]
MTNTEREPDAAAARASRRAPHRAPHPRPERIPTHLRSDGLRADGPRSLLAVLAVQPGQLELGTAHTAALERPVSSADVLEFTARPFFSSFFSFALRLTRFLPDLRLLLRLQVNRDRFVLSNGHACALQYSILHLLGYNLSIDDLKQFRQCDYTDGIEVSTGPLGQGFANAVGIAVAAKHMASRFNKPDLELLDSNVYVIAGDGCMQEGVASEAASLAGSERRPVKLNFCSTDLAFSEDVGKRFEAYGWKVLNVNGGDHDVEAVAKAVEEAKRSTDRPTLIKIW